MKFFTGNYLQNKTAIKLENINNILEKAKMLSFDLNFSYAREWKSKEASRVIVGYTPIYFPREIVHAVNGLSAGIFGSGDRKQIIKGDAYYQSYICHIPRGIIEMVLDGNMKDFDGFVFPSICDVMRNLSGIFQILKKGKFVKYLDFPQNFNSSIGGTFYIQEMKHILEYIYKINKVDLTPEKLNHSIGLFNINRQLLNAIYEIRNEFPWRMTYEELYYIVRAGTVITVEEHNEMLKNVLDYLKEAKGEPLDKIKVVINGAFCEQPPVGLIKTIEMAGCYIVNDDLLLGSRWIQGDVKDDTDNPLLALSEAYLNQSTFSSAVYSVNNPKGERLVQLIKDSKADGVVFAAPSFCDPALLDIPLLIQACEESNIRHIMFQFSENTGQFKVIKEQVGAFADSIKLWEEIN